MNESPFHSKDEARSLIDRQLVASGWLIQSKADMNLGAGQGVVVPEFLLTDARSWHGICHVVATRRDRHERVREALHAWA
jgi:hypothetical protein